MTPISLDLTYMPKGHTGHLVGSPEVVECIEKINNICAIDNLLEFGFNTGWSSALFLHLTHTKITSIEIVKESSPLEACQILDQKFPGRHEIIWNDSMLVAQAVRNKEISLPEFNYCFIDGGHFPEIVQSDIELCQHLGIKNFIFDDPYHENIKPAVQKFGFKLVYEQEYPLLRYKPNKGYYMKSKNVGRKTFLSYFTLD